MVVPPPVELITPAVMSIFSHAVKSHDIAFVVASILIFVPAVKSQDTAPPSIVMFVPPVSVVPPPVELITPAVMSIFSPAVKSQDISPVVLMLIFVVGVNLSC